MQRIRILKILVLLVAFDALATGSAPSSSLMAGEWRWWKKSAEPVPPRDQTPGVRQSYHSGHVWPPQPRPNTPKARLIDQYYAVHYWPYPYTCEDRASVQNVLDQQVANGWVSETTLYDQHFDPETNELNDAGRLHLRWIILYVPPAFRSAFVATGENPAISQARLASTQQVALDLAGPECLPPIMLRAALPLGSSAEERDLLRRKWLSTIPSPRINYVGLPNSSGGGGGN